MLSVCVTIAMELSVIGLGTRILVRRTKILVSDIKRLRGNKECQK